MEMVEDFNGHAKVMSCPQSTVLSLNGCGPWFSNTKFDECRVVGTWLTHN